MVDPSVVRHVAGLARLGGRREDEEALVADLLAILEHFEVLQGVDTAGVTSDRGEPGTPVSDVVDGCERPARLLELTEHAREGFFVVPAILER